MNKEEVRKLVESFFEGNSSRYSEIWKTDVVSRLMEETQIIDENLIERIHEDKLKEFVEKFFEKQSPSFSDFWKADILLEIKKLEIDDEEIIGIIHEEKLNKIITICEKILNGKYQLDYEQINNIVYEAFLRWLGTFDPGKRKDSENPELHWLMLQVRQVIYDIFKGKNSRIDYADIEETFKSLADPSAKQRLEDIVLGKEEVDFEDEYQTVTFKVENSPLDGTEKRYTKKRVAYIASHNIFRYFLHTKRVKQAIDGEELPSLVGSYKHNLTNFINFHKQTKNLDLDLSLLTTDSATGYAKMRHHVLCNAESRRWMELAVAKLRESKEKKFRDISASNLDVKTKEAIAKAPILSSVAVCKDGTIFTCFKGEKNEIIQEKGKDRDITWDKHCEYSLFVDVVKEENMPLLKGGTLFVTLEPCNKRGATGEDGARKAKIPCAVRCTEAGFDHIYIGSFDYDENIRGEGIEILETGEYKFELENGKHKGKNAEGSKLLEQDFETKKYKRIVNTKKCHTYRISKKPPKISYFDVDLMFEIYNLNAEFQHKKIHEDDPSAYKLGVD